MANFTRRSMRVVYDTLKVFAHNHDLHMGIDESDERPNMVKYLFIQRNGDRSTVVILDFEQIDHLDVTLDRILEHLADHFGIMYCSNKETDIYV